jgi:hypothetical protein
MICSSPSAVDTRRRIPGRPRLRTASPPACKPSHRRASSHAAPVGAGRDARARESQWVHAIQAPLKYSKINHPHLLTAPFTRGRNEKSLAFPVYRRQEAVPPRHDCQPCEKAAAASAPAAAAPHRCARDGLRPATAARTLIFRQEAAALAHPAACRRPTAAAAAPAGGGLCAGAGGGGGGERREGGRRRHSAACRVRRAERGGADGGQRL